MKKLSAQRIAITPVLYPKGDPKMIGEWATLDLLVVLKTLS
jgi:hypothetical protein